MLRLVIGVEIAFAAIVMGALLVAGAGKIRMPEPFFGIYQGIVQSTVILPFAAMVSLNFWVFRANKNARALSAQTLEYTPGWAVGWFFVPFASLWQPYKVVQEIYKASRTPHDWRSTKSTDIVGWWWGAYIFGNLLGLVINGASADESIDLVFRRGLAEGLYALIIFHQVLLLILTTRINTWQARAHRDGGIENVF